MASSTTMHSEGFNPNFLIAISKISGAGFPGIVPSEKTILSKSNHYS